MDLKFSMDQPEQIIFPQLAKLKLSRSGKNSQPVRKSAKDKFSMNT